MLGVRRMIEKPLPNNVEAEASVLGACIIKSDVLYEVGELLSFDDFYLEKHQVLYKEMLSLLDRDGAFDLVTLLEHLKRVRAVDKVGGRNYIIDLIDTVPSVHNTIYYARVVKEKARLRKLYEVFYKSMNMAIEEAKTPEEIISYVEGSVFSVFDEKSQIEILGKFYDEYMEKLKEREFVGDESLKSEWGALNRIATFSPQDLIITAGRPGMGKTQFSLNIMYHLAKENIPILFFSIEMSKYQIFERMVSIISGKKGAVDVDILKDIPLYIDDTPRINITDIKLKARRMKAQKDIKALFLDHMQLISHEGKDRYHQMTEVSGMLKGLAKELDIPIIVASQLSRGVEQRINKRPLLSDLRESGAIEQDADVVIFLYREDYYKKQGGVISPLEVIVAKNRNGNIGTVNLIFNKETGRITDV